MSALREHKAKFALLEVIGDNLPALNLYKELGFISFASETQYNAPDENIALPSLPDGWSVTPLADSNWRIRYDLALRTTPQEVRKFEPISEAKFKMPFLLRTVGKLFDFMGGSKNGRFVLRAPDGEAAGVAFYGARMRPGGVNYAGFVLDPKYSEIAVKFFQYVIFEVQRISPGRRIEINLNDWQTPLIHAAEELKCIKRISAYRMGLKFPEN
jgi:hypothetical protein